MDIHHTLTIINKNFPNEPAHIFTYCLNGLYVIENQIEHLTLHNNHPHKTISKEIVNFPMQRTQPTTLYKYDKNINIELILILYPNIDK